MQSESLRGESKELFVRNVGYALHFFTWKNRFIFALSVIPVSSIVPFRSLPIYVIRETRVLHRTFKFTGKYPDNRIFLYIAHARYTFSEFTNYICAKVQILILQRILKDL